MARHLSDPLLAGTPKCADRLDLVDAAYARPGGPEAKELKNKLCPRCPIAEACLISAMLHREEGVWGGTSPNFRTRHGGPASKYTRGRAS